MLTPIQRERLTRLATYLDALPIDYRHFKMDSFFDGESEKEAHYALHNGGVGNCGTSASALGHGPSAGILMPSEMVYYDKDSDYWEVDWHGYTSLFIGDQSRDEGSSNMFDWMFGGGWDTYDGHHYAAAARIKYVLAGKTIPGCAFAHRDQLALYREFDKRHATPDPA